MDETNEAWGIRGITCQEALVSAGSVCWEGGRALPLTPASSPSCSEADVAASCDGGQGTENLSSRKRL